MELVLQCFTVLAETTKYRSTANSALDPITKTSEMSKVYCCRFRKERRKPGQWSHSGDERLCIIALAEP